MPVHLFKAGEAVEPLDDTHSIIQPVNGYRFGGDAVALAHFAAKLKRGARVMELCSGCGVIGIMLGIDAGAKVTGFEIDAALCDMSVRSAAMNGLDDVRFINADIRTLVSPESLAVYGRFDAVVCNPPFFKADSRPSAVAPGANSELTVVFGDIAATAAAFLAPRGELYIVHTATRLDEILCTCREHRLTPKELIVNKNGKTFLLRCIYGGRDGLAVTVKEF